MEVWWFDDDNSNLSNEVEKVKPLSRKGNRIKDESNNGFKEIKGETIDEEDEEALKMRFRCMHILLQEKTSNSMNQSATR